MTRRPKVQLIKRGRDCAIIKREYFLWLFPYKVQYLNIHLYNKTQGAFIGWNEIVFVQTKPKQYFCTWAAARKAFDSYKRMTKEVDAATALGEPEIKVLEEI